MKNKLALFAASLILAALFSAPVMAQNPASTVLIPMGGGYSDLYNGMMQTLVKNSRNGQVNILILPTTYTSNPISITPGERQTNLTDAERRRFEAEEACKRAAPTGVSCSAVIAPVFTRADAADPATLSLFTDTLSAIFILGGNQTMAMQAIIGTPLEKRLEELYQNGVIVTGTSAGCGMQSYAMLGGYEVNFSAGNALYFGAADLWKEPDRHGLTFGLRSAILDQHFFQRSRFARLVNAINLPGAPRIGIGVDGYTGLHIRNDRLLGELFGLYGVAVLDAETYHAADGARYVPLEGATNVYILSTRNLLVHLLAQGDNTYDLATRQHSLAAPLARIERDYAALDLPPGAGMLVLSGYLGRDPTGSPILARFVAASSAEKILIVAAGFKSGRSAQTNAETVARALDIPTEILTLDADSAPLVIPDGIAGVILIGQDASRINPAALAPLKEAWLGGMPLLADNAAAAVLGAYYSNHEPTPSDADLAEIATQKSFIQGITTVRPGLALLDVIAEPRLLDDNRWGRLFSVLHAQPAVIGIGLNDNTALEIAPGGVTALGDDGVFIFDLRNASIDLGSNKGLVIANALMDVFAPGESVAPIAADADAAFQPQPTPVISAATATPPATQPAATPRGPEPLPTTEPASATPERTDPATDSSGWIELASLGVFAGLLLFMGLRRFLRRMRR